MITGVDPGYSALNVMLVFVYKRHSNFMNFPNNVLHSKRTEKVGSKIRLLDLHRKRI